MFTAAAFFRIIAAWPHGLPSDQIRIWHLFLVFLGACPETLIIEHRVHLLQHMRSNFMLCFAHQFMGRVRLQTLADIHHICRDVIHILFMRLGRTVNFI